MALTLTEKDSSCSKTFPSTRGYVWEPYLWTVWPTDNDSESGVLNPPDPVWGYTGGPNCGDIPVEEYRGPVPPSVERLLGFRPWLLKQARRHDSIGDLSKDMVRDTLLPETDNPQEIETYLRVCRACNGALVTLGRAWLEYNLGVKSLPVDLSVQTQLLQKVHSQLKGFQGHPVGEDFLDHIDPTLSRLELALRALGVPLKDPSPLPDFGYSFDDGYNLGAGSYSLLARHLLPPQVILKAVYTYLLDVYPSNGAILRLLEGAYRYLAGDISNLEDMEEADTGEYNIPHWRFSSVSIHATSLSIWDHIEDV